tara:strand:- start:1416 stop:1670 length:255 start_codon:yes stop_codon:yes gene_type:complete
MAAVGAATEIEVEEAMAVLEATAAATAAVAAAAMRALVTVAMEAVVRVEVEAACGPPWPSRRRHSRERYVSPPPGGAYNASSPP